MPDEQAVVAQEDGQNDTVANGGEQDGQQPAQPQNNWWSMGKSFIMRLLFIYAISTFFRKSPSTPATTNTSEGPAPAFAPAGNIYQKNMKLDLYVYISEQENFTGFDSPGALFWQLDDFVYGAWEGGPDGDNSFAFTGTFAPSQSLQNNGSIFLHTYIVKAGKSPNPEEKGRYSKKSTLYRSKRLNKYKKRRFHTSANLLTGETEVHPDLLRKDKNVTMEVLSHWHPNLTINIVDDHTPWTQGSVPAPLDEYIEFDVKSGKYRPILYYNEYWNLQKDYMPINDTVTELELNLQFHPLSLLRWQMYAAQGMRNKWYSVLGDDFAEESDEEQDSLKTALVETNPYLLGLTFVISIVHSVFEFLAFKNDIQFWRTRKSMEGLSVRSVFFNIFQSAIVLLYILDNETNFVVKVSVFIGLLIECWKVPKACDVSIDWETRWFGVIPRIVIADKKTYSESSTKKYDKLAFRYLSWGLYPLLGCYAIYSIFYHEHRGWYSFVLSMLYGFLLTFGFIMMTPQLFINYKMKSVAHLPWRMLTYKALNTFIDDIFAFVIKMPTLYRIGCLRDDVIFFIFLYQRWIYPTDPKRVNEFGTTGEMHDGTATSPEGVEQEGVKAIEASDASEVPDKPQEDKKND